jgi:SAM-dependent methyltransferase
MPAMDQGDRPRNVYDDPHFLAGYSQMDRFRYGWGGGMEHRAFSALVGSVAGRRVLDLGCGAGHLAFYLAEAGAATVVGIDASERMLAVARSRWAHPHVRYEHLAMEDAEFGSGAFDVVVSSLALHYVRDYAQLVRQIASWLVPGGALVFSTEHPIYTARCSSEGWVVGPDGQRTVWGLDDYTDEGLREHHWFIPGVRRYHRTLSTLLNGVLDAGLSIERVVEPAPDKDWLREHPEHTVERRRPMFLLVRARRP